MMIRLIYVSKAVDPQAHMLTESILRKAHAWNAQNDITGVLCQGQGVSDVDPQTKIVWPEFDPYSVKGALVMARIDELVARGSYVQTPAT